MGPLPSIIVFLPPHLFLLVCVVGVDFQVELALQVLHSDKHLLLEKPMAPTPEGCATIIAEAEATAARVRVRQLRHHF